MKIPSFITFNPKQFPIIVIGSVSLKLGISN